MPLKVFHQVLIRQHDVCRGCHVVSANRRCVAGPLSLYKMNKALSVRHNVLWSYEVTVGGALPILSSLRDLLDTGDEVYKIEAMVTAPCRIPGQKGRKLYSDRSHDDLHFPVCLERKCALSSLVSNAILLKLRHSALMRE
jgi:hypothetical protein